ncbi:MAG TPA: ABC transporter permease [Acidimicrobiales bacterium]|nr:ABC transporter permease [Acidimicrobiales bacterium]
MTETLVLTRRAIVEGFRSLESLMPVFFIPLFFFVVNIGQAGKIFPREGTPFLEGQSYAAFSLPTALLTAASFGTAALFLVEEIEGGYFDKLRATPIPRHAIVLGRLLSEALKNVLVTTVIVIVGLLFGVRIESGPLGFLILVAVMSVWATVFAGFMQLVAMKSRSAAATNSASFIFFPLLFLTPNFVPRDQLTRPMEIAASCNPVTYIMEAARSLILEGIEGDTLARCAVVLVVGMVLAITLNVRAINHYD